MKPIVIYLDKHDDEIKLSRKEFEDYINKAYDQGYASGYADGRKYNYYPWWNGMTYTNANVTNATPTITIGDKPGYNPNDYTITCDAHNDIGVTYSKNEKT